MKQKILLLWLAILTAVSAQGDYFVDGIAYKVSGRNAKVISTSSSLKYKGVIRIPSYVSIGTSIYCVTSIDEYAFQDCTSLSSVTIPETVTEIGRSAFSGCTGLTSVTIGTSVAKIPEKVFYKCTSLTSVTIPNSVTSIGKYAFYNCGLTSVTIHDSVTTIGDGAFENCTRLTTANYNAKACTSMGSSYYNVFRGCSNLKTLNIGTNVTSIPSYAFKGCSGLTTVNYNATACTSMEHSYYTLFSDCSNLKTLNIGTNVTSIPSYAFNGWSGLTSVTIPESVTSIGYHAFENCSGLTSVTIGDSVTSIGYLAFENCSGLTEVNYNATACTSMGSSSYPVFGDCSNLKTLNIGTNVTSIPSYAFYDCSGLTSVTIPNSVKTINLKAFYGCSSLKTVVNRSSYLYVEKGSTSNGYVGYYATSISNAEIFNNIYYNVNNNGTCTITGCNSAQKIIIPDAIDEMPVTAISEGAFQGNTNLVSVHIPASVQTIGENAFKGCSNLYKVVLAGNTVPDGLASAFTAVSGRQTYVSSSAYESYASVLGTINVYSNLSSMFEVDGVDYIPVPTSRTAVAFDCDYSTPIISIPSTVTYKNVDLTVSSAAPQTFRNNTSLTTFTLGGEVPTIGSNAFTGCSSLKSFTFEESLAVVDFSASLSGLPITTLSIGRELSNTTSPFKDLTSLTKLYVLGGAKTISSAEFSGCTALTTLGTAGAVNSIEANAFKGFTQLSDISLDGTSLTIGNNAFQNCTKLNNVTIESGINGIGTSAFEGCTAMTKLTLNSGITTLGNRAFYGCKNLNTLSLPSSITSFGDYCFYGCSALQSAVRISSTQPTTIGNYAFSNCSMVPSIVIGNGCTSIGNRAFQNCSTLRTVTFGSNLTTIGDGAFAECSSLTQALLQDNVTTIGNSAFYNCSSLAQVNLPQSLTSLGSSAFAGCTTLPSIVLPANLLAIQDLTFSKCSSLASVTLPSTLTSIGNSAFSGTTSLASVALPATLTSIGTYAFDGSAITSVSLPKGVTIVNEGTFANTNSLKTADLNLITEIAASAFKNSGITELTIPATVLTIGDGAFTTCSSLADLNIQSGSKKLSVGVNQSGQGIFYDCKLDNLYIGREISYTATTEGGYSPFYGNKNLKNVHMGERAISVPENMFAQCTALNNVTLDISVTSMGASAFKGSGVCTINFPVKLTYIPNYAFQNCSRLTNLEIPEHIATIGKYAFSGSALQTITLPATLTTIDEYVFQNTKSLKSVLIAEGTTTIASNAFNGSGLPSITIPNTVTNIENGAFYGCTKLAELNIADGSEKLSMGYNTSNEGLFADCALVSLYQGRDLKYSTSSLYGTSPFYASSTLQSVEIGDIPTSVGSKQFYNCAALTTVKIGDSVTSIGDYAFSGCSNLNTFEVGASIEEIGLEAFSDCTSLTELRTFAAVPPVCGDQALSDIDKFSCTLYVPAGAASDYQSAAQWNEFFFIEAFDAGVSVSYIEISPATSTINVGETLQLNADVYPESALVRTVTWSSENPSIADVNAQGIVTALAEGQTEIIATAKDGSGVTAKCLVNVLNPDKPVSYALSVDEETISATEVTMIPISLTNEDEITSLQCDIRLPEGLALARNAKGNYDIRKADRLDDSFVIASSDMEDAVRLLIYSSQNYSIDGNEGSIFYLPITVTDSNVGAGKQYVMTIDGISLTLLSDYSEIFVSNVQHTFTVGSTFTRGDVNNDGRFSAADVTLTVSYALGANPSNGVRDAADANGDGRISAADVTLVVSYVLSGTNGTKTSSVNAPTAQNYETETTNIHFSASNKATVKVSNLENYLAAQMDVLLPEGAEIKAARLTGNNCASHIVALDKRMDGLTRILVYSPDNKNFTDSDNLIEIEFYQYSANYNAEVYVKDVLLVENAFNCYEEVRSSDATTETGTTGVNGMGAGTDAIVINGQVYNVAPDAKGKIIICDINGKILSVSAADNTDNLNLVPGVYLINSKKVLVK